MNLVIDTSSEFLKVILFSNKDENIFSNKETSSKHLKTLLPEIENLLEQVKIDLLDITNFCVVLGPGSFTGVRIGVSTISAFTQTCNKANIVGINMLDLLSYIICPKEKNDYCVLIKSTSTKFYIGFYSKLGKMRFNNLMTVQEINNFIKENKIDKVYSLNQSFELESLKTTVIKLEDNDYINYSRFLIKNSSFIKKNELKPIYLAFSQAEEELMKKEKANVKN